MLRQSLVSSFDLFHVLAQDGNLNDGSLLCGITNDLLLLGSQFFQLGVYTFSENLVL